MLPPKLPYWLLENKPRLHLLPPALSGIDLARTRYSQRTGTLGGRYFSGIIGLNLVGYTMVASVRRFNST